MKNKAFIFIVLLGLVSLFADMTYEGARSISGPFLLELGASAFIVGSISGLGELSSYGLRFLSGYLTDKTKRYWLFVWVGYALNMLAVPLLAFCSSWPKAALLLILERIGKGIRSPSRDAMLSYASHSVGRGYGFGIHSALDQLGAVLGPLIVAAVLLHAGTFRQSFLLLAIPGFLALLVLGISQRAYRVPSALETSKFEVSEKQFHTLLWAVFFFGLGYVDFPLIAYHFQKYAVMPTSSIPLLFSLGMIQVALFSPFLGRFFDAYGTKVVVVAIASTCLYPLLLFFGGFWLAVSGMVLWGISYIVQSTLIPALVAKIIAHDKRATAYGTLFGLFGIGRFIGSAAMGYLYDIDYHCLALFSFALQIVALIPFFILKNR